MKQRTPSTSREHMVLTEDNPARFIATLFDISRQPDRSTYHFDHEDLEWASLAWNQAAIAALGDGEMLHWRGFYKHWSDHLKNGEAEHKTFGSLWFNFDHEWPPEPVVVRAIAALIGADMAVMGVIKKPSLHRSVQ
jgi:hypothetical protein